MGRLADPQMPRAARDTIGDRLHDRRVEQLSEPVRDVADAPLDRDDGRRHLHRRMHDHIGHELVGDLPERGR